MSFLDVTVISALNELTGNQIQTEEICIDDEMQQQLSQFKLMDQPIQLQDHFAKVRHAVKKQYVEIVGSE